MRAPSLRVIPFVLALEVTAFAHLYARQSALTGSVRQDSGGRPIGGVEVLVEGSKAQTTTDQSGRYLLSNLPAGRHVALFRSVGYRPVRMWVDLKANDTLRLDAGMIREGVQQLEPLEVTGRPKQPRGVGVQGIEERLRLSMGKFIDSAELRRSENRRMSDVIRGTPGLRLVRWRDCPRGPRGGCGPTEERAASGRGATSIYPTAGMEYCWMSVFLNGSPLYISGGSSQPPDFSRDVSVSELQAIEIYRSSAEVPPEYGGTTGACGVILLWSRR